MALMESLPNDDQRDGQTPQVPPQKILIGNTSFAIVCGVLQAAALGSCTCVNPSDADTAWHRVSSSSLLTKFNFFLKVTAGTGAIFFTSSRGDEDREGDSIVIAVASFVPAKEISDSSDSLGETKPSEQSSCNKDFKRESAAAGLLPPFDLGFLGMLVESLSAALRKQPQFIPFAALTVFPPVVPLGEV